MAVDPVCGMEIDEKESTIQATHSGKTFHFCSEECKRLFEANPQQYVRAA